MPDTTVTQFYVYVLRDPRPGKNLQPIYVGKGQGNRAHHHWLGIGHYNQILARTLNKIRKAELEPQIEFVCYFDNEADAFAHEIKLIAQYGRLDKKTGTLCNRTDGGEGPSGIITTEKVRKIRSETLKRLNANPEFAKANLERLLKLNSDPTFAKAKGDRMRKLHSNPEFTKANATRGREYINKINANPKFRSAAAERMRKMNTSAVASERSKKRWSDPAYRERLSVSLKAGWIKRRLHKEKLSPPDHP